MSTDKSSQTPQERAVVSTEVVSKLKDLLKDLPVEVIGHLESHMLCCSNGTVAIVKMDLDGDPAP